jgi:hypothetical protein
VAETVAWCDTLLGRFGTRLNPLIGPLAPFLDPGSVSRESAASRGYRVRYHTLEEHRAALLEPHWRDLLGYDTDCMSRQDIVDATYDALLELNRMKARHGLVSPEYAGRVDGFLHDIIALLARLDVINGYPPGTQRDSALSALKRDADRLRSRSYMVKDELAWPVEGRRFRVAAIAGALMKRRMVRHERA